jgi:serine/threonine protein kinase
MAPEVIKGNYYNHKADVWSLGIIFFELLTGFTPFTGISKEDLTKNIEKGSYRLPKKLKLSLPGLDFLNSCLQYDSNIRMSWEQLVKHPYITEADKRIDQANNNSELHLSFDQSLGHYRAMEESVFGLHQLN